VKGLKVLAAVLEGADAKALRETLDQLKNKLKTAAIVLAAVDGGKVQLAAGVTADSVGKVKAGELVNFVAQAGGRQGRRQARPGDGRRHRRRRPCRQALASVAGWVEAGAPSEPAQCRRRLAAMPSTPTKQHRMSAMRRTAACQARRCNSVSSFCRAVLSDTASASSMKKAPRSLVRAAVFLTITLAIGPTCWAMTLEAASSRDSGSGGPPGLADGAERVPGFDAVPAAAAAPDAGDRGRPLQEGGAVLRVGHLFGQLGIQAGQVGAFAGRAAHQHTGQRADQLGQRRLGLLQHVLVPVVGQLRPAAAGVGGAATAPLREPGPGAGAVAGTRSATPISVRSHTVVSKGWPTPRCTAALKLAASLKRWSGFLARARARMRRRSAAG
jgi:hypothetical protein